MRFHSSFLVAFASVAVLSTAACNPSTEDDGLEVESAVSASGMGPITFRKCSLEPGASDGRAECARVDVPLDWSEPAGRRARFFVKRLRGTAEGAHKQMWLLQGGPGSPGTGLETLAELVTREDPSFDVYIPDHRGTGQSTFLDCPSQSAATFDPAACAEELKERWGADGLATFSTTTAARDVGNFIEQTREPQQEIHVYGVSYGTYWAQRYLQVFPKQPTAVTLDSVCQSGLCDLLMYDYWTDRVGKKVMRECATDEFCADKLGADPVAKIKEAIAVADAGTCAGLRSLEPGELRALFAVLIGGFSTRAIVPAATYRILRCDAGDVAALQHLTKGLRALVGGPGGEGDPLRGGGNSVALLFNIALSEMVKEPPVSRDELAHAMADGVFATFNPFLHEVYDAWPRYERDAYVGKYPTADVPVLLMNGTLDTATPIEFAEQIAAHYTKPSQSFVALPRGTHGVIYGSRTMTPPHAPCGMTLWKQFRNAPTAELDVSCREDVQPIGFEGSPALASFAFGTSDLWENDGRSASPARSEESRAFEYELRRHVEAAWLAGYLGRNTR